MAALQKILVVEDQKDVLKLLLYNLQKEGYQVVSCSDGRKALDLFRQEMPDLALLDIMLPHVDGFEIARLIRQEKPSCPFIFLSARKEETDRILGLELGADDYIVKPFSLRELLSRIKIVLRRQGPTRDAMTRLEAGRLWMDFIKHAAFIEDEPIPLTPKEFDLLKCLFMNTGRALSRAQIRSLVWNSDSDWEISERTIDQYIARLRSKLGVEAPRLLTVKKVGYRLDAVPASTV